MHQGVRLTVTHANATCFSKGPAQKNSNATASSWLRLHQKEHAASTQINSTPMTWGAARFWLQHQKEKLLNARHKLYAFPHRAFSQSNQKGFGSICSPQYQPYSDMYPFATNKLASAAAMRPQPLSPQLAPHEFLQCRQQSSAGQGRNSHIVNAGVQAALPCVKHWCAPWEQLAQRTSAQHDPASPTLTCRGSRVLPRPQSSPRLQCSGRQLWSLWREQCPHHSRGCSCPQTTPQAQPSGRAAH